MGWECSAVVGGMKLLGRQEELDDNGVGSCRIADSTAFRIKLDIWSCLHAQPQAFEVRSLSR
jgi:hypothetical protein